MALDEFLFGRIVRYFRDKKKRHLQAMNPVSLEQMRNRLTILAEALSGKPVQICAAVQHGGYKGLTFFLPHTMHAYQDTICHEAFYVFRTCYLCKQMELGFHAKPQDNLSDEESYKKAAETSPIVLKSLFDECPNLEEIYVNLRLEPDKNTGKPLEDAWFFGRWMTEESVQHAEQFLPNRPDQASVKEKPETILKARPVESVDVLTIDRKQQEDYVLTHNFEKVETAEEFSGTWRDFDGSDQMEDHAEALDELNMQFVVRTDDPVHSIYQSDYREKGTMAELTDLPEDGPCFLYDEWDGFKRRFRVKYSRVYASRSLTTHPAYYQQTLQDHRVTLLQLQKKITALNNKWQQQKRQTDGSELDLDAHVDYYSNLLSGHTPDERLYLANRKKLKDVSILILLDTSLSTDSYADGNHIIDVEKQATILFGELMHEQQIRFSIHGFHSRTRHHNSFLTIKTFDESWLQARYRVATVNPEGYTRIGPALRHAGHLLDQEESRQKWLVLISDGKPNDFDRYEGRYGMDDVRHALLELKQRQIQSFALAIDATARHYLPRMFGQNHYQILSHAEALLPALVHFFEKIRMEQ